MYVPNFPDSQHLNFLVSYTGHQISQIKLTFIMESVFQFGIKPTPPPPPKFNTPMASGAFFNVFHRWQRQIFVISIIEVNFDDL